MTGPGWIASGLAVVMLVIAACCAARLTLWPRRDTGPATDALHVLMGVAMAGMFVPRLSSVPVPAWQGVFAAAAAWFTWQAIGTRRPGRRGSLRCPHPLPHAVESAAMVYMLLPAGSGRPGFGPAMAMPGMTRPAGAVAANPALALVLALFMLGYILWTADRLAALTRARAVAGNAGVTSAPSQAGRPALAPRFAASYKIVMSIAMGYMLLALI